MAPFVLAMACVWAEPARAAEPAVAPPRALVVKAARMFDARAGKIVGPGVVVVQGQTIRAAGPGAAVPAGAEVVDLGDATLLPGFIDAHTHLAMQMHDDWKQDRLDEVELTIPEITLRAVDLARRTLRAGFTTARNLGADNYVDVGLRNAAAQGLIEGPRLLTALQSVGTTGGHCDEGGFREGLLAHESPPAVANGAEALRAVVRHHFKFGADLIKVCATGGVLSLKDDVDSPQMTQAELDAVVDEAHARKRKTAAHAHGNEGALRAVRAGIDSIEHGTLLKQETLDLMKKKGTTLIPTLMAAKGLRERLAHDALPPAVVPKAKAAIARIKEVVSMAVRTGVRIGFGTDAGVYPHGRNAEEFALLVEAGMKPADALRAATLVNADLLGLPDRLGTLEAGKLADVIAVPGDPLADIRVTERVFFVMKDGLVHRNDRRP